MHAAAPMVLSGGSMPDLLTGQQLTELMVQGGTFGFKLLLRFIQRQMKIFVSLLGPFPSQPVIDPWRTVVDGKRSNHRCREGDEAEEYGREHRVRSQELAEWILVDIGPEFHLQAPEHSPAKKGGDGHHAQRAPDDPSLERQAVLLERLKSKMEDQTREHSEAERSNQLYDWVADPYRIEPRPEQDGIDDNQAAPTPRKAIKIAVAMGGE